MCSYIQVLFLNLSAKQQLQNTVYPMSNNHIKEDACGVRVVHISRVNRARDESIPDQELDRLAQTYKVLGDPTRLRIVMALVSGEMCVCDMVLGSILHDQAQSLFLKGFQVLTLIDKSDLLP